MVQRNLQPCQRPRWQHTLAEAVTDPAELLALLALPEVWLSPARAAAQYFPLRVPRGYIARMTPGDPFDPLLRQVLPLAEELEVAPGYKADPVGDLKAMPIAGVLHKYPGRVLLVTTGACAIHCRYCFRRHFPYADAHAAGAAWPPALEYVAADRSLTEVILSGGDPLTLSDRRLTQLTAQLATIPHLRRLRVHTRLPITLPERVDDGLLAWLETVPFPVALVVHANHPQELDGSVAAALAALKRQGVVLLNQAVLLRGVNDDPDVLAQLSETLFDHGVLPYYLHLLDKVSGTAHFDVPLPAAQALITVLRARLPGYLVPRLVREYAGAAAKLPIDGLTA